MLDEKKVREEMRLGLSFICAMCENWHSAVDIGMVDDDGDRVCLKYKTCFSPISGGSFDYYCGPLPDVLKFCYICGGSADKAIEPMVPMGKRVGCCTKCFESEIIGRMRVI